MRTMRFHKILKKKTHGDGNVISSQWCRWVLTKTNARTYLHKTISRANCANHQMTQAYDDSEVDDA